MVEELQLPDASNLPSREGLRTAKADPSEELGSMGSRKFGLGSFQKASNNVEGRPNNKVGVPAFWARSDKCEGAQLPDAASRCL